MGIPSTSKQKLPLGQSYLRKRFELGRTKPALRRSKFPRFLLGATITVIHYVRFWASSAFTREFRITVLPVLADLLRLQLTEGKVGSPEETRLRNCWKDKEDFKTKDCHFLFFVDMDFPPSLSVKEHKISFLSPTLHWWHHRLLLIHHGTRMSILSSASKERSLEMKPEIYLN